MKLIIDLPNKTIAHIRSDYGHKYFGCISDDDKKIIMKAIYNGTPLEEPFDLEGLKSDMKALNCGYPYGLDYLLDCLNKRLGVTIVERKKENKQ